MSNIPLYTGRTNQKQKTRTKILETAKILLNQGESLTLEDVAKASGLSRATVYRYFSNIDILCQEAGLDVFTTPINTIIEQTKHLPIVERILYIQEYFNDLALKNEPAFRKYLSVYLKEDISTKNELLRGARRTAALKLALTPYKQKIDQQTYNKLITVSTALMGIESIICAKDVCGLDNPSAKEALSWGLKNILEDVLKT